ncbi:hypothetical protein D4764_01G0018510 [Takifugu flavidus]|uniref:Uncharacterized protein n=1 Tax=Takifugu flavidus TaxID=433684 RepID=A0A5C6PSR7_9TELE|nr:hypothetical protein D4764_01G0018510 [Takifugu flavidus]
MHREEGKDGGEDGGMARRNTLRLKPNRRLRGSTSLVLIRAPPLKQIHKKASIWRRWKPNQRNGRRGLQVQMEGWMAKDSRVRPDSTFLYA